MQVFYLSCRARIAATVGLLWKTSKNKAGSLLAVSPRVTTTTNFDGAIENLSFDLYYYCSF